MAVGSGPPNRWLEDFQAKPNHLAALLLAMQEPYARAALGLGADSRGLLFGTEGATDPEVYDRLVKG